MTIYSFRDTISAQVQATGFSLQIGGRIWGWAPDRWFRSDRRPRRFEPTRLIWGTPWNGGKRVLFELYLFGWRAVTVEQVYGDV